MKNGLIFCASWFVGSTAVGFLVGRQLRRMHHQQFPYPVPTQQERFLVIPAHGHSYIYTGSWAENGLTTVYRN